MCTYDNYMYGHKYPRNTCSQLRKEAGLFEPI